MSKSAGKAKSSKLKEGSPQDFPKTKIESKKKPVGQVKRKEYPRSYRLDPLLMI